jgi:hypothetical protein
MRSHFFGARVVTKLRGLVSIFGWVYSITLLLVLILLPGMLFVLSIGINSICKTNELK